MSEQQLNVWIPEAYKNALTQRAKREGRTVKALIEELIEQDLARQQGELLERQSLPLMREMIREEVRKAMADLYNKLDDAILHELLDSIEESMQKSDKRLAKLMTRTVRDCGIIRRLLYSLVSKLTSREFAARSYEHATQLTIKELSERIAALPPSPLEEQEVDA